MKIKHIWSVLCQDSTLNQDDNVISLNKIIEELSINLNPSVQGLVSPLPEKLNLPVNYEIVSMWFKERKEEKVDAVTEVTLVSPDGEELLKAALKFSMPENIRRSRSRLKIQGIIVKKSGDYIFKIKVKENDNTEFKLVSEIPLEVKMELQRPNNNL